jgi:hypothetical protein
MLCPMPAYTLKTQFQPGDRVIYVPLHAGGAERRGMTEQEKEEFIKSLLPAEYYAAFLKRMSEFEKPSAKHPPFRTMIERLLLIDYPMEKLLDELAAEHSLPEIHRMKLREVFEWKRKQLQSRTVVFGNLN